MINDNDEDNNSRFELTDEEDEQLAYERQVANYGEGNTHRCEPRRNIEMSKPKSKPKVEVRKFELDEKFREKYSEITTINTIGKVLYLEHYTGAIIQSSYYNDDSIKTVNALRKALVGNKAISPEFDIDGFLEEFGKVLIRSLIQEVEEEKARARKEEEEEEQREQQKKRIQEEITILEQQNQGITFEQWTSTLQEKYQNLKKVVDDEMPEIWPSFEFELSISRILKIESCDLPFIGIILGRPSSYKTVVIELLKRWSNTYYTDNFTARSFVSHSTSMDPEESEEIDMFPRIRNRHVSNT